MINLKNYTIGTSSEDVKVKTFRNRTDHLERLYHTDRHACINKAEKQNNIELIRRIGSELVNTTCKRAKKADWDYRERIIELTAAYVAENAGN